MSEPSLTDPPGPGMRNVVLIGFSGTGKSVVARRLAARLGWGLVDLDAEIVRRENRPIHSIFATSGEAAFRAMEQRELERACARTQQVIATGGGAVMNPRSRALLRRDNLVFLLDASPDTIHRRLTQSRRGERRPMIEHGDPLRRIQALKNEREPVYRLAAHAVIPTDDASADQVMELLAQRILQVLARLERRFRVGSHELLTVVGPGAADNLTLYLERAGLSGRVRLVADARLMDTHGARVESALRDSGRDHATLAVTAGETAKSLASAERIYDWLIETGTERGDTLVALGGGVIGDLAGFVAATYLRGIPLVQVPTTLLAMVDSSIGGKVGINHRLGKNLIGAFHQPRLVIADTAMLQTLPRRELAAGWAEVVKTGLILDAVLFRRLEADPAGLLGLDPDLTVAAIARSVELKAMVVAEDERESGRRMLLNYGHTIGHAIEAATDYERYLHGEAVAIGMSAAGRMAVELGMISRDDLARQDSLLDRLGLPRRAPSLNPDDLWAPMRRDKKARQSRLRWVLLAEIGRAVVRDDVPEDLVERLLGSLTGASRPAVVDAAAALNGLQEDPTPV